MALDPSIALNPNAPNALSTIGGYVNLGRSALELQKAKETLAADIAQRQAESNVAVQTQQPRIEQQQAQTQQSQTAAELAKFRLTGEKAQKVRQIAGGYVDLPAFKEGNLQGMLKELPKMRQDMIDQGIDPSVAEMQVAHLITGAAQNPADTRQRILTGINQSLPVETQAAQQRPTIVQTGQGPAAFTTGGAGSTGTVQPLNYGGQQQAEPAAVPSAQTQPSAPNMNLPTYSQPVALPYPPPKPGMPRAQLPSEEGDRAIGQESRNLLVQQQSQLPTLRRNLDELISEANKVKENQFAKTGGLAQGEAWIRTHLLQDEHYQQLSKDIANVALSNMKALGHQTDASQALVQAANGSATMPMDVLLNIAGRAKADMTQIGLKADAKNAFAQKFGDANHAAFESMWTKNADSRVMQAIAESEGLSGIDKKAAVFKSLGIPFDEKKPDAPLSLSDKQKIVKFQQQYNNVMKMVKEGSL